MSPRHLRWYSPLAELLSVSGCTVAQLSLVEITPDSKVHGANMGPTWVLSAPGGPHVGPMNFVTRDNIIYCISQGLCTWFVSVVAWQRLILTFKVSWDFLGSRRPFWMMSSSQEKYLSITSKQWYLVENMCNCVAIIVPADDLEPWDARTSAGTVMTRWGSHIYMVPAFKGLTMFFRVTSLELEQSYVCHKAN